MKTHDREGDLVGSGARRFFMGKERNGNVSVKLSDSQGRERAIHY